MSEPDRSSMRLADGQWHRLHPATPLLRGGIALIAIIGVILVNLRDVIINIVLGDMDANEPFEWLIEQELLGLVLAGIAVVLLLAVGGFWLSWRMHSFRITDDEVEVRSGILFRTQRRGRLDRIQGINVVKPFIARLFGASKLEISVAGDDANIPLAYLGSAAADELRREILVLAAGARPEPVPASPDAEGGLIERRVGELLGPELDAAALQAESVVSITPGRLLGSMLLSGMTIAALALIPISAVIITLSGSVGILFGSVPAIIGLGGYQVNRFVKTLRYSIASTPDGIRVGYGLLSTANDTLPPGRIHAVQVSQPLLWRIPGWWMIRINRAAGGANPSAAAVANATLLPVGDGGDVRRVLALIQPALAEPEADALVEAGLHGRGGEPDWLTSPRRAAIFSWFAWRRNGISGAAGMIALRQGRVWRTLVLVPAARLQSVSISQGPLARSLRLAGLRLHTVAGPIIAQVGNLDAAAAVERFSAIAAHAVRAAADDRSHRWRSATPSPSPLPSPESP